MFDQDAPKSCEAEVLARQLLAWSEELAPAQVPGTHLLDEERSDLARGLADAIRTIRRGFDLQYGKLNFGDPTLRVMLEIVVHEKKARRLSLEGLAALTQIDRVCVADSVQTLTDLGLVVATPEKCDGRNVWLHLSQQARDAMFDMLLQTAEFLRPRGCGLPL
ncbi:hypothetical protein KK137_03090 [Croceibacterium sp. LX-88]|uniref:HTH marR-type domain-containing protein n=1 Tax=Croceibacterium selenioxidans TaxID=2838833 RepID=A0ABS5W0K2_9SPHN|nr:hypothetical protein [Croceibacterium selenioxidans]MBT2133310.1 hypothetical protein [Croceibacterium selenioxidans]